MHSPPDLFGSAPTCEPASSVLSQYPTPGWLAEEIIHTCLPGLSGSDHVLEPTCGAGALLAPIPNNIEATGVELDPVLVHKARVDTGRRIIQGDVLIAPLDIRPTHVVGNPPFKAAFIDQLLTRLHGMLPPGGTCTMILPVYYLGGTPERTLRLGELWGIQQRLLPKSIYPRISLPLMLAQFEKGRTGTLVGFAFFQEADGVRSLRAAYQALLNTTGSVWATAAAEALRRLGGEATLQEIYSEIGPKARPTPNPYWKAKLRQVLQLHFKRTAPATYTFNDPPRPIRK